MKKVLKIFSVLLLVFLLTGCGIRFNLKNLVKNELEEEIEEKKEEKEKDKDKDKDKDEDKDDKKKTSDKATCSRHYNDYNESYYMMAKNNKIYQVNFKMIYDKENDLADFTTYTSQQKEVFINAMYENLGVDDDEEGIDVDIKITDTLIVEIDADLEKADPDVLKKLGFNFGTVNNKLDRAVANFEASEYICVYN